MGCGEIGNTIWLANQKRWKCRGCKKQFSVKVGTIMEDSPISLDKWMVAFWMLANCRNGVSSYEIMRAIGVTQKCTWHMLHRIRLAMTDLTAGKLGANGPIEVDETFVGGKMKNMHKSRRVKGLNYSAGNGKAIVMGMLERGGRVRAGVIADRKIANMRPMLEANVEPGLQVITDEHVNYPIIAKEQALAHEIINQHRRLCSGPHPYQRNREGSVQVFSHFPATMKIGKVGRFLVWHWIRPRSRRRGCV